MREIYKPKWRSVSALKKAIVKSHIAKEIKEQFRTEYATNIGRTKEELIAEEIETCYPILMSDTRIFDVNDMKYWAAIFIMFLLFLATELGIFFAYSDFIDTIIPSKSILAITLASLLILVLYLFLIIVVLAEYKDRTFFKKIVSNPSTLRTIPLSISYISLIATNLLLVINSGWAISPFLPSFLCMHCVNSRPKRE